MHHKSWGRRHQIEVLKAQVTRSLLTFVLHDMLLVVRPPSLISNGACAYAASCVYPPPPSLRQRTAAPDTATLCEMRPLCYSRRCVRRMRRRPWFLVRHACLELRRLMPAGWPCQVGACLLGLFAFFLLFLSFFLFFPQDPPFLDFFPSSHAFPRDVFKNVRFQMEEN